MKKLLSTTGCFAVLILALASGGAVQSQAQERILFVVHDLSQPGNPLIGDLAPGETLYMRPGDRLRVSAVAGPEPDERDFVRARFELTEARHLALEVRETGVAVLEAGPSREGEGTLRYELEGATRLPERERSGTLQIEVSDRGDRFGRQQLDGRRANEIVASFYRGILLREPDGDQTARVEAIQREGYPAIVQVAREIAGSRESQIGVYERGCEPQRLLALYRHLLGLDQGAIPLDEWKEELEALADRRYEELVEGMTRREEFIARFDLEPLVRRSAR